MSSPLLIDARAMRSSAKRADQPSATLPATAAMGGDEAAVARVRVARRDHPARDSTDRRERGRVGLREVDAQHGQLADQLVEHGRETLPGARRIGRPHPARRRLRRCSRSARAGSASDRRRTGAALQHRPPGHSWPSSERRMRPRHARRRIDDAPAAAGEHLVEAPDAVHVATEGSVVVRAHRELDRRDDRRRRHRAEAVRRHLGDIDHYGDAASRPDVDRRAAAGDVDERDLIDRVSATGFW